MATVTSGMTDLELLHRFIGAELARGGRSKSIDECLAEFRDYLNAVERLREEIRPALERSFRGESNRFDPEDTIRRGRERLRERGISE